MPALSASSCVRGGVCIPNGSHIPNQSASVKVRTFPTDLCRPLAYHRGVARRGVPKSGINWYLPEWMAACGLEGRGAQSEMMRRTGWPKATMSQLFNGTQDYSPKLVNEASKALSCEAYELLMPPEKAMAIRKLLASAQQIVTIVHDAEKAREEAAEETARGDGTHG